LRFRQAAQRVLAIYRRPWARRRLGSTATITVTVVPAGIATLAAESATKIATPAQITPQP
jgi:hypothetical protein